MARADVAELDDQLRSAVVKHEALKKRWKAEMTELQVRPRAGNLRRFFFSGRLFCESAFPARMLLGFTASSRPYRNDLSEPVVCGCL